jgi:hypothetical protein
MRTLKKTFYLLLACLIFGVSVIGELYSLSKKVNHDPNGFIRRYPPIKMAFENFIKLKYYDFYVAGGTKNTVYFANRKGTSQLFTCNYALADTHYLLIHAPDTNRLAWKMLHVAIDSPDIYLMEGFSPSIAHIRLSGVKGERFPIKPIPFTEPAPLSHSSFVMQTHDDANAVSMLTKQTVNPPGIINARGILQKQIDGTFCVDGMLLVDTPASRVLYVYYYRNQFMCMDTNLNLLYRAKTIDTVAHAHIRVETIYDGKGGHETTMAAPPLLVNRKSCVDGNWLYINSTLVANNERKDMFDKHTIIDVYSVRDGTYQYSFILPNRGSKRVTDFKVINKKLFAVYDNWVYSFSIDLGT